MMEFSAVDGVKRNLCGSLTGNNTSNLYEEQTISDEREESTDNASTYDEEQIIKAIEKANKSLAVANTRIEFSIHEQTRQIMVKIIDGETDEIIREIPPEKILDMVAKLWELAGLFVDEKI